jgi:hypothetical protein
MKYGKKGYFIRECGTTQGKLLRFRNRAQSKSILKNNNQIKGMRECTIKHFIFYYNSAYIVYKNTKYSTGWWLKELILSHVKAIQELDNE